MTVGGPAVAVDRARDRVAARPDPSHPRRRKHGRIRRNRLELFGMTVPAYVIYAGLFLLPAISTFYYSLTSWNGLTLTAEYVGLANFRQILDDPGFTQSIVTTGVIAGVATIALNVLGLTFALLMRAPGKVSTFYRAVVFAPIVLNEVAVGFLWRAILGYDGALNSILGDSADNLGATYEPIEWLGTRNLAVLSVITVIVWQSLGFNIVLYLAGLSRIPADLVEAAMIDGANRWQVFRNVTIPALAPAITINIVYTFIGLLHEYARIQALTAGGPASATTTLSFKIVLDGLQGGRPATASAQAAVLSVATVILALSILAYLRRRESSMQ